MDDRFFLMGAAPPLENFDAGNAGYQHATVAHDAHFQVFVGKIEGKHAQMQRAADAIFVFKTDRRMVMHLMGTFDNAVDGATAECGHASGP